MTQSLNGSISQRFMHRARGGDDEVAVEEADGGGAAIDLPDVGLNRAGDDVDERLSAFGAGHLLFGVVAVAIAADDIPASATASAAAAVLAGEVEVRAGDVADVIDRVVQRHAREIHLRQDSAQRLSASGTNIAQERDQEDRETDECATHVELLCVTCGLRVADFLLLRKRFAGVRIKTI